MSVSSLRSFLFAFIFFLSTIAAAGQSVFTISGKVVDDKNSPAQSATVFLSGTQDMANTDTKGEFTFSKLEPGAYKVIIKYADYLPVTKAISLQKDTLLQAQLSGKVSVPQTDPRETLVGRAKKLEIFRTNFLGKTDLGVSSKILNPEVLYLVDNLKTNKLEVTSNEFLVIENRELGYTIKYLLKALVYDYYAKVARFDGDAYFEEMLGTDDIKQLWRNNRAAAYRGSMMHFFRSVYQGADEPLKQGFIVQTLSTDKIDFILSFGATSTRMSGSIKNQPIAFDRFETSVRASGWVNPQPTAFDSLVSVVDDNFLAIKFKKPVAVTYNPEKAAKIQKTTQFSKKPESIVFTANISAIQSDKDETVIDSRGNFNASFPFSIMGQWDKMRIADMLPYNYRPDQ